MMFEGAAMLAIGFLVVFLVLFVLSVLDDKELLPIAPEGILILLIGIAIVIGIVRL
jgi:hypothetical protein